MYFKINGTNSDLYNVIRSVGTNHLSPKDKQCWRLYWNWSHFC